MKKKITEPLLLEGGDEPEEAPKEYVPIPLTRQQINQCIMEIQDIHPLKNKVYIEHICPIFRPCCKQRSNFRQEIRLTILKELGLIKHVEKKEGQDSSEEEEEQDEMIKNERAQEENPFLRLGYGVNSYFSTMMHLVKMFSMITIFLIPIFMVYKNNETRFLEGQPQYVLNQFSLGNLGGA